MQAGGTETDRRGNQPPGRDVRGARLAWHHVTATDTQNFGGGNTLGVRQVAAHHHGAAQRNGEQHAQHATGDADPGGLPEREIMPVAGHEQARHDEDDAGQRARGRSLRLHHVVFQDGAAAGQAQHGHGNYRGWDGAGKCQTNFEAQIDIGGGKHRRNQRAQDQAAQGKFSLRHVLLRLRASRAVSFAA